MTGWSEDGEKRQVGAKAAEYVAEGMYVGLGSGSTVYWLIQALADRVKTEGLKFEAVATSKITVQWARQAGILVRTLDRLDHLDLTIDGADEVDPQGRLIKGGGGALVRERLVAAAAERYLIIVDQTKLVATLGAFPLPIEVIPFGWTTTAARIARLGVTPIRRRHGNKTFVSDNHNYILDAHFQTIDRPHDLYRQLRTITGVVDAGIFAEFSPTVLVSNGTEVVEQPRAKG